MAPSSHPTLSHSTTVWHPFLGTSPDSLKRSHGPPAARLRLNPTYTEIEAHLYFLLATYGKPDAKCWFDIRPIGFATGAARRHCTHDDAPELLTYRDWIDRAGYVRHPFKRYDTLCGFFVTPTEQGPLRHAWCAAKTKQKGKVGKALVIWDSNSNGWVRDMGSATRDLRPSQQALVEVVDKREVLNEVWFAGDEHAGVEKSVERAVECAARIMKEGGLGEPSTWEAKGWKKLKITMGPEEHGGSEVCGACNGEGKCCVRVVLDS